VRDIPCGTSGGVVIQFESVEVVNKLHREAVHDVVKNYTSNYDKVWIFDKIHHELNQFCSRHTLQEIYIDKFQTVDDMLLTALQESCDKWAPGIEIIAVRITKPILPPEIMANYVRVEGEKSKLAIAVQAQKVTEKAAETERRKLTIEAEARAEVSKIQQQQLQYEKESERVQAEIEDRRLLHHQKTIADATHYAAERAAHANALLHTDAYIQLELGRAIANNSKVKRDRALICTHSVIQIYFGTSAAAMTLDFVEQFLSGQQKKAHAVKTE
jgi:regulator of protease activity HflC (stomatin/prohibitin superfamily)